MSWIAEVLDNKSVAAFIGVFAAGSVPSTENSARADTLTAQSGYGSEPAPIEKR
jgi:hypothetical protein